MKKSEEEQVKQQYQQGVENFTEKDLDKVMADTEIAEKKGSKLGEQVENFRLLWNLLKDYYNKVYPRAPWKLIAAIGFAVTYLVSPADVIPDFLPIIGFIDDAAVFALVVKGFESDISDYKEWQQDNKQLKQEL